MSARLYSEVNHNTIPQLKIQGYRCVQFILLDFGIPLFIFIKIGPGRQLRCFKQSFLRLLVSVMGFLFNTTVDLLPNIGM